MKISDYLTPSCKEGETLSEELDNIKEELNYLIENSISSSSVRVTAIRHELPIRLENLKKYDNGRGVQKK